MKKTDQGGRNGPAWELILPLLLTIKFDNTGSCPRLNQKMLTPAFRNKLSLAPLLLLLTMTTGAPAQAAEVAREVRIFTGNHPAAETLFVPALEEIPPVKSDAAWYVRTGAAKGLSGHAETPEELFAAPDVAVLGRGFAALWEQLLAEQQETSVLVRPDEIAGLIATKPILVIPSGALSGAANSSFLKAALAHYVRSGGMIYCLAQQAGRDYSALPVPEGGRIEGAGWSEDSGPLFRASTARTAHLLLRGLTRPAPAIETEGYFTVFPDSAQVLLRRSDGAVTLIVYPLGKGWVVAGTLFTDFSFLLGDAESEEKLLIRNLLAWKSERGQAQPAPTAVDAIPALLPDGALALKEKIDRPVVTAVTERKGDTVKLSLELPGAPRLNGETLLVRVSGQEQLIRPGKDRTLVSAELPVRPDQRRISFVMYRKNGRALVRGSVEVPSGGETRARLERQYYFPGDTATVAFTGTGKGEVTLRGLDYVDNKIIADQGSMSLPVPMDLPAGAYRLQWLLEKIDREKTTGDLTLNLSGYRVEFEKTELDIRRENGRVLAKGTLRIFAGRGLSGKLKLQIRGPGGKAVTVAESVVGLAEGSQTVPLAFEFVPDASGLWDLTYSFSTTLAIGVGLPTGPLELASGSTLFDVGKAAILAVGTDSTFYYEPAEKAAITATLFGTGKARISVQLAGRTVATEQVQLSGTSTYSHSLPRLKPGSHAIRVMLTAGEESSFREQVLINGLSFPDLYSTLAVDEPRAGPGGPVLPFTMLIRNRGKNPAGPSKLALYEGDPSVGGKAVAKLEVPELMPGREHTALFDLPLARKAGRRAFFALVNGDHAVQESRETNNTASMELTVPDLLLLPDPEKRSFQVGDAMAIPFSLFNLTDRSFKGLTFTALVSDPAGKKLSSETLPLSELTAAEGKKMVHPLRLSLPKAGTYTFSAAVSGDAASGDKVISKASTSFTILPTLLLTGTLEGTLAGGVLCNPFSIDYSVRTEGNLFPTSGTIKIEIALPGSTQPLVAKRFPLRLGQHTFVIDALDLPPGNAVITLTASAYSEKYDLTRDFKLAEQTLSVSGPIEGTRKAGTFPRVLVWLGREGRTVEQAVMEAIVKQAFDQDDLFYRIVYSEEDFTVQSRTGLFNTYVLIEPQEMPARTEWLKDRVDQGQGLILIGSGAIARQIGEGLGFSFEEVKSGNASVTVSFVRNPGGMELTGSLPVNGIVLQPRKRGAAEAGVYAPSGRSAVLVDGSTRGKTVVMPLSFSYSAYTTGTPGIYSLVLRSMALFAAPETDTVENGPKPMELSISSPVGPVRARIKELLPPGSRPLWTNAGGTFQGSTISYEVTADKEPRKLLYLYEQSLTGAATPYADVSYECKGIFTSQGKIN